MIYRGSTTEKTLLFMLQSVFLMLTTSANASNLYLGQISRSDTGLKVVDLMPITDNAEYTNQPYFFDENTLYFTQEVKDGDSSQMDSFRYDIERNIAINLTNSAESEYSPTPMPDGTGFSVVRVDLQEKQELWQLGFGGIAQMHLLPAIEPVGYHSWTRDDKLLLFVLGEPNTLVYANPKVADDTGIEIAKNVGVSIFEMPIAMGITYTIENDMGEVGLFRFDTVSGSNRRIGFLPEKSQYYAWSPRAELFTTDANKLVAMPFIINNRDITYTSFTDVEIESEYCQNGISRIAISPYEEKIALVCGK